ncbi:MAG: HU family DNA-binding protein [Candidatus Anammoxibacter sp.]
MRKIDLVNKIANGAGYTKVSTSEIVNLVFETISESLKKGESVNILGFGSFNVVQLKAKKGRDWRTGKELKIPARKAPKFKASENLKALVQGKQK